MDSNHKIMFKILTTIITSLKIQMDILIYSHNSSSNNSKHRILINNNQLFKDIKMVLLIKWIAILITIMETHNLDNHRVNKVLI